MAEACQSLLAEHFPKLDTEVSSYINGILDEGTEEFECSADLYDAIGDMLSEVNDQKNEDDIRSLCHQMFTLIGGSETTSSGPVKILGAPVHLASMVDTHDNTGNNSNSIWLAKKESVSRVDQKKLDKVEAKLKEKQEKRAKQENNPRSNGLTENTASASQQSSRRDAKMESSGSNKSYDIRIENFDVAFGEKVLIQGADIQMSQGRRYGLVGRNGIGKTTLLRMIAGKHLQIPSHIRVLHVEQEVVGDETIALQSVLECDETREKLLTEERAINAALQSSGRSDSRLSSRLAEIYHALEAIEADKAPARASVILAGLGFSPQMQRMTTKEFSGGWRMRLALARALFSLPDLLLLDEPTNMLDIKAIIWLEDYLQTWPSTILVVSHDRSFLNAVATDIFHLHTQIIDTYKGDYEVFLKTRTERLKNQQKEYEAQKHYRDHIQEFIDRFRYNANRASQVQSKLKLLEKLPVLKPVEKESEVILRFPEAEKLSSTILQLDEVSFHYTQDRQIFSKVCISASMTSRICIVGENGAGKTTLLKILLGDLNPTSGLRHVHRNLRIGYFSQHHVDQLEMGQSCVEVLASRNPGKPTEFYRTQLGSFGVSGELALRPVSSLSGGQKSRVAFSQMSMTNPNFFILDEPTNHLDMETIEALGKALNKFQGGVILVSHDERLIRMICTELWVCSSGNVQSLEGGIDEYKKLVQLELNS